MWNECVFAIVSVEIRGAYIGPVHYRFLNCKDKKKQEVIDRQQPEFITINYCQTPNRPVKALLNDPRKMISQNKRYFQSQHIDRNWV